jgi:hypothetical protein
MNKLLIREESVAKKNLWNKGELITFGMISWMVLNIQNNMALILSEKIIDSKSYHDSWTDVNWETSALRKYLNYEFIQSFTNEE